MHTESILKSTHNNNGWWYFFFIYIFTNKKFDGLHTGYMSRWCGFKRDIQSETVCPNCRYHRRCHTQMSFPHIEVQRTFRATDEFRDEINHLICDFISNSTISSCVFSSTESFHYIYYYIYFVCVFEFLFIAPFCLVRAEIETFVEF